MGRTLPETKSKKSHLKIQVWKTSLFIWGRHLETILCAIQPCEGLILLSEFLWELEMHGKESQQLWMI